MRARCAWPTSTPGRPGRPRQQGRRRDEPPAPEHAATGRSAARAAPAAGGRARSLRAPVLRAGTARRDARRGCWSGWRGARRGGQWAAPWTDRLAGAPGADRTDQPQPHRAARHAAWPALPAPATCRRQTGQLPARRGLGCGAGPAPRLADLSALACRMPVGRQRLRAADPAGLCPWLSGADRCRRTAVLPLVRPCAGGAGRTAPAGASAGDWLAAACGPHLAAGRRPGLARHSLSGAVPVSAARPPEGAHTAAAGEGAPAIAARPPEGARTVAAGEGAPVRHAARPRCRHCGSPLPLPFLDLGSAPPSNAFRSQDGLRLPQAWFPLRLLVCECCWLVQTQDPVGREALFTGDYAYFSAFSTSWLGHAQRLVQTLRERLGLTAHSCVVEVGANDGYLLQYVQAAGIPCYGVEPTASTAAAARSRGLTVVERFFGLALAQELAAAGRQADLLVANNVLAHVPDIDDFVAVCAWLLKPQGLASFEFAPLLRMVQGCQFDTAYHEHYSYLSLTAAARILAANGLALLDVQELPTHGGRLRLFGARGDAGRHPPARAQGAERVARLLAGERQAG